MKDIDWKSIGVMTLIATGVVVLGILTSELAVKPAIAKMKSKKQLEQPPKA